MARKTYTNREKRAILKRSMELRAEGNSNHGIAATLNLQPKQIRAWEKQATKLTMARPSAMSVCSGRKSALFSIQEDLLKWFFENREQGRAISVKTLAMKASELSGAFRQKTARAKDQCIRRFTKSNGIAIRVQTHESQRPPNQVTEEALDFIRTMRPLLDMTNRDKRFILNMDQTPVFFTMVPRTTLNAVGERTVTVRSSTSSTMRVTVAVTVTAAGNMLKPMIVFKGKPAGRIQREFGDYDAGGHYCAQDNAWMDENVMKKWIDIILKPYIQTAPPGIHPIILLDSYRCHMMKSVVGLIEEMGCQVEHIPGGCTGLCQPVDVGIGKPLKNRIRDMWDAWMFSQGTDNAIIRPPSRALLASWIVTSIRALPEEIIKNSWLHKEYSYFSIANDLNDDQIIIHEPNHLANDHSIENGDGSFANI